MRCVESWSLVLGQSHPWASVCSSSYRLKMPRIVCLLTDDLSGVQRTWQRLINSESGITSTVPLGTTFATLPSQVAGIVPDWTASEWCSATVGTISEPTPWSCQWSSGKDGDVVLMESATGNQTGCQVRSVWISC